jgi:hypothetical protein
MTAGSLKGVTPVFAVNGYVLVFAEQTTAAVP